MFNIINKEMYFINKYLIVSNCFIICVGIKYEKNNFVFNSILEKLLILIKLVDKIG